MLEAVNIRRVVGECYLLNGVSLVLNPGERLAIVGPTGSGKTLFLRAIALLDPIDTGEVLWRGRAVHGNSVPEFRSQVIYLHQRPALVEGTVEDNLRIPFTLRTQQGRQYSRDAIQTQLKQVDCHASFLDRSTRDLSGGEAQIVALLRAIQLEPTVLLLDEPTAALDAETTQLIEQLLVELLDAVEPHVRVDLQLLQNRREVRRNRASLAQSQLGDWSNPTTPGSQLTHRQSSLVRASSNSLSRGLFLSHLLTRRVQRHRRQPVRAQCDCPVHPVWKLRTQPSSRSMPENPGFCVFRAFDKSAEARTTPLRN